MPALHRLFPDIVSSVAQGLYRQNSSGISQEVNLLVSSQPLFCQSIACCTTRISLHAVIDRLLPYTAPRSTRSNVGKRPGSADVIIAPYDDDARL